MFLVAVAQLFAFLLLPFKNRQYQKQTKQCAARASATKTLTKINAEGTAERWPWIYVGNYVSYYVDKKQKPWHLRIQLTVRYEALPK